MRQMLALLLAAQFVLPPLAFAQQQQFEKPVAALGRVAVLGDISEGQRKIIETNVESLLSRGYDLVSQEQYARAEEAAFASLDLEKCTEDECIRKIQELLQVDRLFVLQIIKEGTFVQLSLTLMREEQRRVVKADCEGCTITEMNVKIDELASQMIAQDLEVDVSTLLAGTAGAGAAAEEDEGGISIWWWILGGLAIAGIAAAGGGSSDPGTTTEPPGSTESGTVVVTY